MNEMFLKQKKLSNVRIILFYPVMGSLFLIVFLRLINLQIVKGNENLCLSSAIRTSQSIVRAPRGLIYDRNGELLVVNRPSFRLVLDLKQLPRTQEKSVIKLLAQILEKSEEELWHNFVQQVYGEGEERISLLQITLLNDVQRDKIVSIHSRSEDLPGIFIEMGLIREYEDGERFAHITGYVQEASASEVLDGDYLVGDIVGSIGLEKFYDEVLRGVHGKRVIETYGGGEVVREFVPVEARGGDSIRISIDSAMQAKMTEALRKGIDKNNADGGAAIILDATNGEILSLVSLPAYDPNKIVEGLSLTEYATLSSDPSLPLYNRAISMVQPPGSTFKTIVACAGLQEEVINTSSVFVSEGCLDLGGGIDFCEVGKVSLGELSIHKALARSSNIFFCKTLLGLGIDKLNRYMDDFGLGQKTGVDLYGEQGGIAASKEVKQNLTGESWYLGDSCNTSIGQGLTKVSPLQMAVWMSAIANGGTFYKPHLVTAIVDADGKDIESFEKEMVRTLAVDVPNLDIVKQGMHLVVNDPWGSAFPLRGLESDPAAKTGSAEAYRKIGDGKYEVQGHSWITGFFPYNDPRYAFVVYLEFGGWGFRSAEVMHDFLEWYDGEY